jgi:uncharacterized protein (DUF4415 family)
MHYSWDSRKNRSNIARHGIAFDDAARIFEGPTVEKVDDRFDYGELRVYAIGLVNSIEITLCTPIGEPMRDASSRHGDRNRTKGASFGRTSRAKGTDWKRLRRMSAAEIRGNIESDPDVRGTDKSFWKGAKVVLPRRKEVVTMRLDADLLDWFRQHRGYQTRINAILRAYMNANDAH